jgi:uncharacterized repeat protein (TIGR03803 family)
MFTRRFSPIRCIPLSLLVLLALVGAAFAQTETIINAFNGTDGSTPWAGMIFDNAGNLYGTTAGGGAYGAGTVFELSPTASGWQETILYSFQGKADGEEPYGGLVFDAAGNLYGTTFAGGRKAGPNCSHAGCGTVFKLSPSDGAEWTKTILHTFTGGKDGYGPIGTPVLDAQGNVYGTTNEGGTVTYDPVGNGVVFELSPTSTGWKDKILHSFTGGADGRSPYSGVVFDSAGNLYGSAEWAGNLSDCQGFGCGVIYKLSPNPDGSWRESLLHTFTGGDDGGEPWGGVILDSAGNVYGTTYGGGANQYYGVVFKLSPNSNDTWRLSVLHSFDSTDGQWPEAGVVMDAKGNLYGTTFEGGANSGVGGVVFELSKQTGGGWMETVLHSFFGTTSDGEYPSCTLVVDSAGNVYGTTQYDGPNGYGTVFEITP